MMLPLVSSAVATEPGGLSDHEILMELREDMKKVLAILPTLPTWGKLGAAAATIASLVFSAFKIFG